MTLKIIFMNKINTFKELATKFNNQSIFKSTKNKYAGGNFWRFIFGVTFNHKAHKVFTQRTEKNTKHL